MPLPTTRAWPPAYESIAAIDITSQPWGRGDLMATAAVRYCLGRTSYIVSDCGDWLRAAWPKLSDGAKAAIKRDVEEAIRRDNEAQASGQRHNSLGHDCDREVWHSVRLLWAAPGASING